MGAHFDKNRPGCNFMVKVKGQGHFKTPSAPDVILCRIWHDLLSSPFVTKSEIVFERKILPVKIFS